MTHRSLLLMLAACTTEVQPTVDYAVYTYGDDTTIRDQLIRAERMVDDLGGAVIGHRNDALAASLGIPLTDIPDPGAEEVLWIIAGHDDDPATQALADAGRAVWTGAEGATLLLTPADAPDPGFRCHGAVRRVRGESLVPTSYANRVGVGTTVQPGIAQLLGDVSLSRMQDDVDTLVAFGSRRHGQPGEFAAQGFLEQRFDDLGLAVETLDYDTGADVVCGVLPGQTSPEQLVIVGAHYDSVNWQGNATSLSPGADDDASGTAAVLEIARIMTAQPGFDHTLRFCAWSGEEFGLLGSDAEARRLAAANASVVGMVQLDMIGHTPAGSPQEVEFILNDTSTALNTFLIDIFAAYVPTLATTTGFLGAGSSDHASFFAQGFPASWPFEDPGSGSPLIHTAQDVVGTSINDWSKAELITKGTLAGLAELAGPLSIELGHDPLANTTDDIGPYTFVIDAQPQTNATVATVDLRWRVAGETTWTPQPMQPVAGSSQWTVDLPALPSPTRIEYTLEATDSGGNISRLPNELGARPYEFAVGVRQSIALYDFEAATDEGWTHVELATQDDWQRGQPTGRGGDAGTALSGANVWGNDLGPAGFNGTYQPNVDSYLESPPIDTTGMAGVRLRYGRWLTVESGQYDQARVSIDGTVVWENPFATDVVDTAWIIEDLDVSAVADDRSDVRLRWSLTTDGGLELGGWNIDDVELYTLAPSQDLGPVRLLGPTTATVGDNVTLRVDGFDPQTRFTLVVSTNNRGTTVLGEPLEVGEPLIILGTARTDAAGVGSFTFDVPSAAAGRTIYLEAGAVQGSLVTTNLHTMEIR